MQLSHTHVSSSRRWAALLATASVVALATPAHADHLNPILAGGLGAVAGAMIGQSVGGRDGAIIGSAIGGATGVALSSNAGRSEPQYRPGPPPPVYMAPAREVAYYQPYRMVQPAYAQNRYGWGDQRHHGYAPERREIWRDEWRDEHRGNGHDRGHDNGWRHDGR